MPTWARQSDTLLLHLLFLVPNSKAEERLSAILMASYTFNLWWYSLEDTVLCPCVFQIAIGHLFHLRNWLLFRSRCAMWVRINVERNQNKVHKENNRVRSNMAWGVKMHIYPGIRNSYSNQHCRCRIQLRFHSEICKLGRGIILFSCDWLINFSEVLLSMTVNDWLVFENIIQPSPLLSSPCKKKKKMKSMENVWKWNLVSGELF